MCRVRIEEQLMEGEEGRTRVEKRKAIIEESLSDYHEKMMMRGEEEQQQEQLELQEEQELQKSVNDAEAAEKEKEKEKREENEKLEAQEAELNSQLEEVQRKKAANASR